MGNEPHTIESLVSADDARWAALIAADVDRLGELIHDDLAYTHSNGMLDTKQSYLDALSAGTFRYVKVDRDHVRARAWGTLGIITGRAAIHAEAGGQGMVITSRFSSTWLHGADGWQMLCWHSCPLAEAP